MLKRYWRGLPWDGLGWAVRGDPVLANLRYWAATKWRRSKPFLLRPCLWLADRLLWPVSAGWQSLALARMLKGVKPLGLYRDCLMSGAGPLEAHIWRSLYGNIHPLPGRAASRLMLLLGDPAAHQLLTDKLAAASHLADAGVAFPAMQDIYRQGQPVAPPAPAPLEAGLFLKPRHGHGGRGCFSLAWTGGQWLMDGRPVREIDLMHRLVRLSRADDLLVQERLVAAPDLSDLCAGGRAPILRLVTARLPKEKPFLHSAMLTMGIPGRNPSNFLRGALHSPVDPALGRLSAGVCLAEPRERMEKLSWNGAPLAGRRLDNFGEAVAMALCAMAALPPLPLVHWDVILTSTGPVMLEGNSCGNWIIANLPGEYGLAACALPPLLACWVPERVNDNKIGFFTV